MKNSAKENQDNQKAVLTARTGNALAALRKARESKDKKENRRTITVKDPSTMEALVTFQIRALSEREYEKARTTTQDRLPSGALRRNISKERAELIYLATVDEDKPLWNSREILDDFDTNFPRDVIEDTFSAGDKVSIVNAIDALSGFDDEVKTVDVIEDLKN